MNQFFVLVLLTFLSSLAMANVTVSGVVIERGTKIPMTQVRVFILPHRLVAETDSQGRFEINNVPEGDFEFVVNQSGYLKFQEPDSTENAGRRTLLVQRESYTGFETVVVGQKDRRDNTSKSLSQKQFLQLPGSGGDPVKAVQNLPGVNRVAGFSSQVVIQGSAPNDTLYHLDGHEIPLVFHFGGLTSVVMPEAVERVDYFSAGYGPELGRAMGGIVSLVPRPADTKVRKTKGLAFADTLKAGGLIESQLSDQDSILVSGRYSYIGQVLRPVLAKNEAFNLTVVPEFSDINLVYNRDIDAKQNFRLTALYSKDSLGFLLKEPIRQDPSLRGTFSNTTEFYRILPTYSLKGEDSKTYKISAAVGEDRVGVNVGDNYFNLKNNQLSTRGEVEDKSSEFWHWWMGLDSVYSQGKVSVKLPTSFGGDGGVSNPISGTEVKEVEVKANVLDFGAYFKNEFFIPDTSWSVGPSVRADSFSLTKESFLSPRLAAKYKLSEHFLLKSAGGVYYQSPEPQQIDSTFGNPNIKAPRAIHMMVGFERDFKEGSEQGFSLNSSLFDRWFDNLVIRSTEYSTNDQGEQVPELYNNKGAGRAYGWEMLLKYDSRIWSGWISYTLARSTRWNPKTLGEQLFEFDQTHNLNIVGSYNLKDDWKVSGRYRYVTGNPNTPVVGASFDSDNDVYIPVRGGIYSERLSAFQQVDLRIDKTAVTDEGVWSIYLDIQNLLNTKNPESIQYAYDYSVKQEVSGLPILPSLGVKGEF